MLIFLAEDGPRDRLQRFKTGPTREVVLMVRISTLGTTRGCISKQEGSKGRIHRLQRELACSRSGCRYGVGGSLSTTRHEGREKGDEERGGDETIFLSLLSRAHNTVPLSELCLDSPTRNHDLRSTIHPTTNRSRLHDNGKEQSRHCASPLASSVKVSSPSCPAKPAWPCMTMPTTTIINQPHRGKQISSHKFLT